MKLVDDNKCSHAFKTAMKSHKAERNPFLFYKIIDFPILMTDRQFNLFLEEFDFDYTLA